MIKENCQNFVDEQFPTATWVYKKFVQTMASYNIASCLKGHGVGRHSLEEVEELVKLSFSSLETRLKANQEDGGKWFFGNKGPSEVDAAIYGVLATTAMYVCMLLNTFASYLCSGSVRTTANLSRLLSRTPSTPLVKCLVAESPILSSYVLHITEAYFPEYTQLHETLTENLNKK